MPKAKKDDCPMQNKRMDNNVEDFAIHGENSSPISIRPDETEKEPSLPVNKTLGKKRMAENDYDPAEFSHEMQKMLEGFGADISKTLSQKKKRMEQLTQASLKNANKKVEEIWTNQQVSRAKLQEEFSKQMHLVYQQWETDIQKSKEQEDKLNSLFKQQQKFFQQSVIIQSQRLKTIKDLSIQFIKGLEELERSRQNEQVLLQSELKKEMQLLQKRILMDTQQEMANVRKSLHSMLY